MPLQPGHDAKEEEADHFRATAGARRLLDGGDGRRQDVAAVLEAAAPAALRLERERGQHLFARRHPGEAAGEEAPTVGRAARHRGGDHAGQAQETAPERRE